MPDTLSNREERFCVAIAAGLSAPEASRQAGYKANPNAAYVDTSRRLRKPKIANRIHELQAANALSAAISVESLTVGLLETIEEARAAGQCAAAVSGYMVLARLHGLLVDRHHAQLDIVSKPMASPTSETELSYEAWSARWARPLPGARNGRETAVDDLDDMLAQTADGVPNGHGTR